MDTKQDESIKMKKQPKTLNILDQKKLYKYQEIKEFVLENYIPIGKKPKENNKFDQYSHQKKLKDY